MLTKITEMAWVDFSEIVMISYENDKLKVTFRNDLKYSINVDKYLIKPFLKALNEYYGVK